MTVGAAAAAWVVKQGIGNAGDRLRSLVLGTALEQALGDVTLEALRDTAQEVAGMRGSDQVVDRLIAVFDAVWPSLQPDDLVPNMSMLEAMRTRLSAAVGACAEPVSLGDEFETTSVLSSLEDELGVEIDPVDFAQRFLVRFVRRVQQAGATGGPLTPLAAQLSADVGHAGLNAIKDAIDRSPLSQLSAVDDEAEKALVRIRGESRISVADASLATFAGGSDAARLDDGLYVSREAEAELDRALARAQGDVVVVVGAAGCGKTSVLWHLHQQLTTSGRAACLVKATQLNRRSDLSGTTLAADLVHASAAGNQRTIVLIDTVDVEITRDGAREAFLELVTMLKDAGTSVVAACRPQQASLLRPLRLHQVFLGDYTEAEVEDALDRYSRRFYREQPGQDGDANITEVLDAVASGLPVREICMHPLTLRMLFELYAPNEIPREIHTFDLYRAYWTHRVENDRRAGAPDAHAGRNLSATTEATALTMLAEGLPELDGEVLRQALDTFGGFWRDVSELGGRGVLQTSSSEMVSFFHQTFFEHAAARALLHLFAANTIAVLHRRAVENPSDLYLTPVHEQALLLAENMPLPIREQIPKALGDLLARPDIPPRSTALYVYGLLRRVDSDLTDLVTHSLANEETEVIVRLLDVIPNARDERLRHLVQQLDVVWSRGRWPEQGRILELLARVGIREPRAVLDFVERHQLIAFARDQHDENASYLLVAVVATLSALDPDRTWKMLLEIWTRYTGSVGASRIHREILKRIGHFAKQLGATDVATRAANELIRRDVSVAHTDLEQPLGELWAIEWRAQGRSIVDALTAIDQSRTNVILGAQLDGLTRLILADDTTSAITALELLRHWNDDMRRLAVLTAVPPLLRGAPQPNERASRELAPRPPSLVVQSVRDWTRDVLATPPGYEDDDQVFVSFVRKALINADLPPTVLLPLLPDSLLRDLEPWLDRERYSALLVPAYLGGHAGATTVVELLRSDASIGSARVRNRVRSQLADAAADVPRALEATIDLAISASDATRLARTLASVKAVDAPIIASQGEGVARFATDTLLSNSSDNRRDAALIYIELARLRIAEPPPFLWYRERVLAERLPNVAVQLVGLLRSLAMDGRFPLEETIALLEELRKRRDNENLVNEVHATLASLLIHGSSNPPASIDQAFMHATARPFSVQRARLLGDLIERLTPTDPRMAANVLIRISEFIEGESLGRPARRDLAAHLRTPTRNLIAHANTETNIALLEASAKGNVDLGRMIIESACKQAFVTLAPTLDRIIEDVDTSSAIKDVVRKQKYQRQRTAGGASWPELYTAQSGLSERRSTDGPAAVSRRIDG